MVVVISRPQQEYHLGRRLCPKHIAQVSWRVSEIQYGESERHGH